MPRPPKQLAAPSRANLGRLQALLDAVGPSRFPAQQPGSKSPAAVSPLQLHVQGAASPLAGSPVARSVPLPVQPGPPGQHSNGKQEPLAVGPAGVVVLTGASAQASGRRRNTGGTEKWQRRSSCKLGLRPVSICVSRVSTAPAGRRSMGPGRRQRLGAAARSSSGQFSMADVLASLQTAGKKTGLQGAWAQLAAGEPAKDTSSSSNISGRSSKAGKQQGVRRQKSPSGSLVVTAAASGGLSKTPKGKAAADGSSRLPKPPINASKSVGGPAASASHGSPGATKPSAGPTAGAPAGALGGLTRGGARAPARSPRGSIAVVGGGVGRRSMAEEGHPARLLPFKPQGPPLLGAVGDAAAAAPVVAPSGLPPSHSQAPPAAVVQQPPQQQQRQREQGRIGAGRAQQTGAAPARGQAGGAEKQAQQQGPSPKLVRRASQLGPQPSSQQHHLLSPQASRQRLHSQASRKEASPQAPRPIPSLQEGQQQQQHQPSPPGKRALTARPGTAEQPGPLAVVLHPQRSPGPSRLLQAAEAEKRGQERERPQRTQPFNPSRPSTAASPSSPPLAAPLPQLQQHQGQRHPPPLQNFTPCPSSTSAAVPSLRPQASRHASFSGPASPLLIGEAAVQRASILLQQQEQLRGSIGSAEGGAAVGDAAAEVEGWLRGMRLAQGLPIPSGLVPPEGLKQDLFLLLLRQRQYVGGKLPNHHQRKMRRLQRRLASLERRWRDHPVHTRISRRALQTIKAELGLAVPATAPPAPSPQPAAGALPKRPSTASTALGSAWEASLDGGGALPKHPSTVSTVCEASLDGGWPLQQLPAMPLAHPGSRARMAAAHLQRRPQLPTPRTAVAGGGSSSGSGSLPGGSSRGGSNSSQSVGVAPLAAAEPFDFCFAGLLGQAGPPALVVRPATSQHGTTGSSRDGSSPATPVWAAAAANLRAGAAGTPFGFPRRLSVPSSPQHPSSAISGGPADRSSTPTPRLQPAEQLHPQQPPGSPRPGTASAALLRLKSSRAASHPPRPPTGPEAGGSPGGGAGARGASRLGPPEASAGGWALLSLESSSSAVWGSPLSPLGARGQHAAAEREGYRSPLAAAYSEGQLGYGGTLTAAAAAEVAGQGVIGVGESGGGRPATPSLALRGTATCGAEAGSPALVRLKSARRASTPLPAALG